MSCARTCDFGRLRQRGSRPRSVDLLGSRLGWRTEGCVVGDAVAVSVGGDHACGLAPGRGSSSVVRLLRKSYEQGELDEEAATNKPLEQFAAWFADARRIKGLEPNAMTLATASADGRPSARVVLLKEFDASGLVWYTNYDSRKGAELDANPVASLLFFWAPLERQVRVEGRVEKVTPEESDAYYAVRPLDSRIGAWASPQSQVIANRGVLVANAAKAAAEHGLHPLRPDHWGGYRLVPEVWEFWQGRTSRLHDRLRYRLEGGDWVRERLAP